MLREKNLNKYKELLSKLRLTIFWEWWPGSQYIIFLGLLVILKILHSHTTRPQGMTFCLHFVARYKWLWWFIVDDYGLPLVERQIERDITYTYRWLMLLYSWFIFKNERSNSRMDSLCHCTHITHKFLPEWEIWPVIWAHGHIMFIGKLLIKMNE